jgi:hypothetical protein
MGKKNKMSFKKYDKLMRSVPGSPRNSTPRSCNECMYYQPCWKYRTCTYTKCPYGCCGCVFRKKPLGNVRLLPMRQGYAA